LFSSVLSSLRTF